MFWFQPLDRASALVVTAWQYDPPYDLYNTPSNAQQDVASSIMNPEYGYHSITDDDGNLVAYCCFGPDGQVPGGDYRADALDIGLGVRPDLTGQGHGFAYVQATFDYARDTYAPTAFRVTVAEFNKRAQRVWTKAGFQPVQRFERHGDRLPFIILMHQP